MSESLSVVIGRLRSDRASTRDWGRELHHATRVRAAYTSILGRAAEPEGLAHWETFLSRGGSFDALLRGFVRSSEFRSRLETQILTERCDPSPPELAQVRAAYVCLLARPADPEGQAHWMDFLRKGGQLERLLIAFVRSAEFRRRLDVLAVEGAALAAAPDAIVEASASSPAAPSQEAPTAQATAILPPAAVPTPPIAAPLIASDRRNRFAVIGNCQSVTVMYCLQALTGCPMPRLSWTRPDLLLATAESRAGILEMFRQSEKVFVQPAYWQALAAQHPELEEQVVLYPSVAFSAYHPDVVYVRQKDTGLHVYGPCHDYQSSLAFLGWQAGFSVAQTLNLFNPDVFGRLGFFDSWRPSEVALIEEGRTVGLELGQFLDTWRRRGSFMLSMNHPKPFVILDIVRALLDRLGVHTRRGDLAPYVYDFPSVGAVWPIYPQVGARLGVSGNFMFKLESPELKPDQPVRYMGLKDYVEQSFAAFSRHDKHELDCDRMHSTRYQQMLSELQAGATDRVVSDEVTGVVSPLDLAANVVPHASALKLAVLGDAQAGGMARCLQAMLGGATPTIEYVTAGRLADWESGRTSPEAVFARHDKVFVQPWIWKGLSARFAAHEGKVVLYPSVTFAAYHPDLVEIELTGTDTLLNEGPTGSSHSALTFLAWSAGLTVPEAVALFRRDVLKRLGYFDQWRIAEHVLLEEGRAAGLPLESLLSRWKAQGCFMHLPTRPKLFVLADIADALLQRLDIPHHSAHQAEFAYDRLAEGSAWPVYPEIAEHVGGIGGHAFKQPLSGVPGYSPVDMLELHEFIERSFATYDKFGPGRLACRRLTWPNYLDLLVQLKQCATLPPMEAGPGVPSGAQPSATAQPARSTHPYAELPAHRFWRKAIQGVAVENVDPVVKTKFSIGPDTRVATAGSCFALNISRRLLQRGYNFLQAEPVPHGISDAVEGVGGMGLFSARFGYLYTARQLRQLMQRAYGDFVPDDTAWMLESGRFVDPFRPRVEPEGFVSIAALEQARSAHLAAVRRMFESLDVMVFTLGMTEAWRSRRDGAVFSVAPGVAGGQMDFARYEFVNFTVAEVDADLQAFIDALNKVNPRARVILTVSPVPILATYADRHVLVSSTYTKSVLRVAAEQVSQRNAGCDYFPGYELVNGSFHRGRYIADDLRSVTSEGVDHVMRLFFAHYSGDGATASAVHDEMLAEARKSFGEVCDEELLDPVRR